MHCCRSALPAAVIVTSIVGCGAGNGSRNSELPDGAIPDAQLPDAAPAPQADAAWQAPGAGGSDAGSGPPACNVQPGSDGDGDGFAHGAGDCDDCIARINPGSFEVAGNLRDDDCDGQVDVPLAACDQAIAIDTDNGLEAARALGLCDPKFLRDARWVYPDGSTGALPFETCPAGAPPHPLSHGVLASFGSHLTPPEGARVVAISSGVARDGHVTVPEPGSGTSPDGAMMCRSTRAPEGFPKASSSCPGVSVSTGRDVWDGIALELSLVVPSNAVALSFDFNFFTLEFPFFVCSEKNDHFVAVLTSSHPATPPDGNISVDSAGNLVSVNNALLEACAPVTISGKSFTCPRGLRDLEGTPYLIPSSGMPGDETQGGATGWVRTRASVVPGETIRLRLATWDGGDGVVDTLTLLDNFQWIAADDPAAPSGGPLTEPVLL